MSTELGRSEVASHGLRRLLMEQISGASEALRRKNPTDEAVHEARKRLKVARATLRLLRPAIGKAFGRSNAILRDAARPLSAVRDSRVLTDTLDGLSAQYGLPMPAIKAEAFRLSLERDRVVLRRRVLNSRTALATQSDSLEKLNDRIARWKVEGDWDVLGAGMKRVYSDGRKALKAALSDGSAESFHAWRKQAKFLWHQLQILEPVWPGPIGERADQLHKLSDYLGEDHDLYVLREKLTAWQESSGTAQDHQALLALIEHCRARLQQKAGILGRRLYDEKPAAFEKRFRRYWQLWKQEPAMNPEADSPLESAPVG